jgi:hypothetical protein
MPRIHADQVEAPEMDDAEMMQGGPGVDAPAVQDEPVEELKTVRINGKEYKVDAAMAAALDAREKDFQRKLSEQAESFRRVTPARPAQPEPEVDNLDTLLFEKPKEALSKFEQRIIQKVTGAYQADQGQREFWADFNAENPDLARHGRISRTILSERFNEWAELPSVSARQNLAEAVRAEIAGIIDAHRPADAKPKRTVIEGVSTVKAVAKPKVEAQEYRTLSDVLAARRRRHLVGPAGK